MKKFRKGIITHEEVSEITCNACNKIIWVFGKDTESIPPDFLEVSKDWGYSSKWDLENHSFDICMSCYDMIISNFKHPIQVEDYQAFINVK